jgi:hypothetical protein
MAIGTPSWGSIVATNGAAPAPTLPASTPVGGCLVTWAYSRGSNVNFNVSGWTSAYEIVTANGSLGVFVKDAVGTEGGTDVTYTATGLTTGTSGTTCIARAGYLPGTDAAQYVTPVAAETEAAVTNGTNFTNAGLTPSENGCLILFIAGKIDGASNNATTELTAWAGGGLTWTGASLATTSGLDACAGSATALQATAASTGNLTVQSNGISVVGLTFAMYFKATPVDDRTGTATDLTGTATLGVVTGAAALDPTVETGTATDLTGTASLGLATGTAALEATTETGTATDLTGTATLSTATGDGALLPPSTTPTLFALTPDTVTIGQSFTVTGSTAALTVRSGTATELSGTAALATTPGTKAVSQTAENLAETAALGLATGAAALDTTDRTGTATELSGSAILDVGTGTRSITGTAADIIETGTLATAPGAKAVSEAATSLTGDGSLATAPGIKAVNATSTDLTGSATLSTATGQAAALQASPAPTLTSLTPSTVTIGQSFTVTGTTDPNNIRAGTAESLTGSAALGLLGGWSATPVTIPATLNVDDGYGTAAPSGNNAAIGASEWIEWEIDAGAGGTFDIELVAYSLSGALGRLLVDEAQNTDFLIPSQEEEGDIMPAHVVNQSVVSLSTANATRVDPDPAAAKRYKVTLLNTHATDRIYVAHSQAACVVGQALAVEADMGERDFYIDANVQLWARRASTNTIDVRVFEHETE